MSIKHIRRKFTRRLIRQLGGVTREQFVEQSQHLDVLQDCVGRLEEASLRHSQTAQWLGTSHSEVTMAESKASQPPLISVIMPTWNRQQVVRRAIESVRSQSYAHWELLVVDDGSEDRTREVVSTYLDDERIRLFAHPHRGMCESRNFALAECRGDIVAYLDSDNTWFPDYLQQVANALETHPEKDCVYLAQLVENVRRRVTYIRRIEFDQRRYCRDGGIDLNVFAHRKSLYERHGGFDEHLTRLTDWDLITRYTRDNDPIAVDHVGGWYEECRPDSNSVREDFGINAYRIRRKGQRAQTTRLSVLYALEQPQHWLNSHVRTEIDCMRRWGVHVEVWSGHRPVSSSYWSDVPAHFGALQDAIASARPHIVHAHGLQVAIDYADTVDSCALSMTVREHRSEASHELIAAVEAKRSLTGIFLHPLVAEKTNNARVHPMPVAFNGDWYSPSDQKDPRLVIRCGDATSGKDLKTFIDVAKMCPDHRFVLALSTCQGNESFGEELVRYNKSKGNHVDLRLNLSPKEMVAFTTKAGIYLHTNESKSPFGMPISIAEAMATGAFVVARRSAECQRFMGQAGAFYGTAKEAARIIKACDSWESSQWKEVSQRAIDHAFTHYCDVHVLWPLLDHWEKAALMAADHFSASVAASGRAASQLGAA